jgi:hypothetical protein
MLAILITESAGIWIEVVTKYTKLEFKKRSEIESDVLNFYILKCSDFNLRIAGAQLRGKAVLNFWLVMLPFL